MTMEDSDCTLRSLVYTDSPQTAIMVKLDDSARHRCFPLRFGAASASMKTSCETLTTAEEAMQAGTERKEEARAHGDVRTPSSG